MRRILNNAISLMVVVIVLFLVIPLSAPVLDVLEAAGCTVRRSASSAEVGCTGRLRGAGRLVTGGYPALATDAVPLVAAALLTAEGETLLEDRVFASRFGCAAGFAAMGADVSLEQGGRALRIRGVRRLHGAEAAAPDLRGGAALVLAALAAQGESRITGCGHIRRGYPDLGGILSSLGARMG